MNSNFWQDWRHIWLAWALFSLMLLPFQSYAQSQNKNLHSLPDMPVVLEAKLSTEKDLTILTFTFTRPVPITAFPMAQPDRLILDLPLVNFQISDALRQAKTNLVKSVRYGALGQEKSRIIIDLSKTSGVARMGFSPIASGFAHALRIEIEPMDPQNFAKEARLIADQMRAQRLQIDDPPPDNLPAPTKIQEKIPLIMIDPGHGGPDFGAVGLNNIAEKDVVLAFARALREKIDQSGQFRAGLTREGDVFIPLRERIRIARSQGAQLFISIHADRIPNAAEVKGITIYTNAEKATDAEAALLAESENRADLMGGEDTEALREEITDILEDLAKRETRMKSGLFARTLLGRMESMGQSINKNPIRSAGFRVLRAPDIPSVLLELGYLSSQADVKSLTDPASRDKMAQEIADAIFRFFALKPAP
jgi:N-acetylmuramoyl-L-alanine amidase